MCTVMGFGEPCDGRGSKLEGMHDAVLREPQAGHERHATEYQADIQARDHEAFELKELIFKLCVEMDELREDVKKIQAMPGKGLTDAPEYQEQVSAFRQSLDGSLQQLVQERKIREGEQRLSQLQEEVRNS